MLLDRLSVAFMQRRINNKVNFKWIAFIMRWRRIYWHYGITSFYEYIFTLCIWWECNFTRSQCDGAYTRILCQIHTHSSSCWCTFRNDTILYDPGAYNFTVRANAISSRWNNISVVQFQSIQRVLLIKFDFMQLIWSSRNVSLLQSFTHSLTHSTWWINIVRHIQC